MTLFKIPKNGERVRNDNLVVGYFHGKAIIKNEMDSLFFIECDECHAPTGTIVENENLTSISALSAEEEQEIKTIYLGD